MSSRREGRDEVELDSLPSSRRRREREYEPEQTPAAKPMSLTLPDAAEGSDSVELMLRDEKRGGGGG